MDQKYPKNIICISFASNCRGQTRIWLLVQDKKQQEGMTEIWDTVDVHSVMKSHFLSQFPLKQPFSS